MAIDLTNPQGEYGGDFMAAAQILQLIGQVEKDRRERQIQDSVLSGIASGKDFDSIVADVVNQQQNPEFAGGMRGGLQRFAGAFSPQGPGGTEQILSRMGLSMKAPARPMSAAGQATADLAQERAQTERTMRPARLATEQARTGQVTAAAGAQKARQHLTEEQAATVEATRPEQIEAVQALALARQGKVQLTQAQIETLVAMRPEEIANLQARTAATAGTAAGQQELAGERAETVRAMRPGQLAGQAGRVAATGAQAEHERALTGQAQAATGTQQARTGLIGEQIATEQARRPEEIAALTARRALTGAQTATATAQGQVAGERAQTIQAMRPEQVATQQARTGETAAGQATQEARGRLLGEQAETAEALRPEQVEAAQALTAARQGRVRLTQQQIETLLAMRPEELATAQAKRGAAEGQAATQEAQRGLVGERAETVRQMRPEQVATQKARTGEVAAGQGTHAARTGLVQEQARTAAEMRPEQVAGAAARTQATRERTAQGRELQPGKMAKQAVDIEHAQQELAEARLRMAQPKAGKAQVNQEYQHQITMADMALDKIRYGGLMPGDEEYDRAMAEYDDARSAMEGAWESQKDQASAPPTRVTTGAKRTPAPTAPVPGLTDIWSKFDANEQAELRKYYDQIVTMGPDKVLEWQRKVRSMAE